MTCPLPHRYSWRDRDLTWVRELRAMIVGSGYPLDETARAAVAGCDFEIVKLQPEINHDLSP